MPTVKLTKRSVDGIKPSDARVFWYDTDLKGFGLKVEASGTMTWFVEYRADGGGRRTQKRRLTLGKAGVLTPDEARQLAKNALARVYSGDDPAAAKAERKAAKTMADLCDEYLAEAEKGNIITRRGAAKKASTLVSDRGRIARHIKPLLGKKLVRDVTSADVERFLRDVANGKTATDVKTGLRGRVIVTGGKGTATRTVRLLGGIFTYAIGLGLRADNPTHGVRKYADNQGGRFLNQDELMRLGQALLAAETIGLPWRTRDGTPGAKHLPKNEEDRRTKLSPHATAAIRLLILTGCRVGEILSLKWSFVDLERGFLFLPDSKTGARTVILGAPAVEVLKTIPRVSGFDYVIVGEHPDKPRSDLKRPWSMVRGAAGLDDVRLHDLRHTYASHGAAAGMGLTVVGRLLGHADIKTTSRYSHFDADPLRRAANAIGSRLEAALDHRRDHPPILPTSSPKSSG